MNPGRQTISDESKLPEDVTLDVSFMRIGEYQRFVEFYCTGYHTYVRKYLHDIRGMYATNSIVIHHRRWSIIYTLMAVRT
jgi:hypothetical protein